MTNIDRRLCEHLVPNGEPLRIDIGGQAVTRMVATFTDIAPGEICGLYGSTDHLELAAQATSAAVGLGVAVGTSVSVTRA